jgi:HPt (histidine-containing phosphotransfer) domain-containing protein
MDNDDQPVRPIDLETFRAVMREAGIEEEVDSTLAIYLTEAPAAFARLEAAVENRDIDAAASAAHALKSASSNVWATGLVALLEPLEKAAREGDVERVEALVAKVRPLFAAAIDQVRGRGSWATG